MKKENYLQKGAEFSDCGKYRFSLWRIWDETKPFIMFIGLNPSTANADTDDHTITTVRRFAKDWGYGGVFMLNCFPFISTDPKRLEGLFLNDIYMRVNEDRLKWAGAKCSEIVFAWGSFKVVREQGIDARMWWMFPTAKALKINADGSPHHPLRLPSRTQLVKYQYSSR